MTAIEERAAPPATAAPGTDLAPLVDATRRLLGCAVDDVPAGTHVADWLSISRFVEATGDENPLYLDVVHGAQSWWRTMLAPPAFVLGVRVPESRGALHRVPLDAVDVLSSLELWWDDHIRLGDRVGARLRLTGVGPGPTWRGRATVDVMTEAVYRSQGRAVARGTGVVRVHPLRLGGELFVDRSMHRYTPAEIERITAGLDAEPAPRGPRPRFHDEVAVGDRLPTVVRGPVTWSELITWIVAEGRPAPAGNLDHRRLGAQPGRVRPHPATGWPVNDRDRAREELRACADVGFPAPCARGSFVVALAAQLVTTWMGDDAFLRRLAASLDAPVLYGDTVELTGRVSDLFVQRVDGREYAAASLDVTATNQLGERVLHGDALVFLPRRGRPVELPVEGGGD